MKHKVCGPEEVPYFDVWKRRISVPFQEVVFPSRNIATLEMKISCRGLPYHRKDNLLCTFCP